MLPPNKLIELTEKAKWIRGQIIKMLTAAKSGHSGGSLSAVEVLTYLYSYKMNIDPTNPHLPERDRFILSKGHAAPVLYSALAGKGYFEAAELLTLRRIHSNLQGHPDRKKTPGVDASTGSLGHGLSIGNGLALAGKVDRQNYRVYVLMGDGELEEGQVWEALMTSAHYSLDNLTAFIDHNHLQIDGAIEDVKSLTDLGKRFIAFGWHVIEIDGHDFQAIDTAVLEAENTKGKPTMIILQTCKGKGCSFMENKVNWHGIVPDQEKAAMALQELGLK